MPTAKRQPTKLSICATLLFAATALASHDPPKTVVIAGDSIEYGQGATDGTQQFTYRLVTYSHWNVQNFSHGGMSAEYWPADATRRIVRGPVFHLPTVLVIMLGVNDMNTATSAAEFETVYRKRVIAATHDVPNLAVVLVSPIYCLNTCESEPNKNGVYLQDIRDAIANVAVELGVPYIDGKTLVPPLASLYADHVHLNAAGQDMLAAKLWRALRPYVE
jgi:lysophospholipase L1-like esterase